MLLFDVFLALEFQSSNFDSDFPKDHFGEELSWILSLYFPGPGNFIVELLRFKLSLISFPNLTLGTSKVLLSLKLYAPTLGTSLSIFRSFRMPKEYFGPLESL